MPFPRSITVHHSTSLPFRFFGRAAELALLEESVRAGKSSTAPSVIALVGPGGQGKTAIVQHWLEQLAAGTTPIAGVFFWSFYRGKDADLCLRELYACVGNLAHVPDVSGSYCVDRLLPLLRGERWVLLLDGTEVVQYDAGTWFGRFVHPELGRLLEELASAPLPGVVVLTTRFPVPELERRSHARVLSLECLDRVSARGLLTVLGVRGDEGELDAAADFCGFHAKAVELLGTYLVRFAGSEARSHRSLPDPAALADMSAEEHKVLRVIAAFQNALPLEAQDILALATAFRDPPTQARLVDYLHSPPVHALLHQAWGRRYLPFEERTPGWLAGQIQELVDLRLLERVQLSPAEVRKSEEVGVIDAHPLVRRAFEHVLGVEGRRQSAGTRAGFLHGLPNRKKSASLDEAHAEAELFHAYCLAGLWPEADSAYLALDKPRYRFVAPAFERDLLLQFFPGGDWRRPPLWSGFRHYRALAICLELLGNFDDALVVYREEDAVLRGDALIALGRLEPLLGAERPFHPWQVLGLAYRAHALCLAGRTDEALSVVRTLVPVDVYEWTHVFECLLRAGQLNLLDMRSFLYRPPHADAQRWNDLAQARMRADYLRGTGASSDDLGNVYEGLLEEYDRGGLPFERALTRLSHARWLLARGELARAQAVNAVTRELTRRQGMRILEADAWHLEADLARRRGDDAGTADSRAAEIRRATGYGGPGRP